MISDPLLNYGATGRRMMTSEHPSWATRQREWLVKLARYITFFAISNNKQNLMSVSSLPPVLLQLPFMQKESTYRINVYTFNKTLAFADRIKRIDVRIYVYLSKCASVVSVWNQWFWFSYQALEYLPFEGTVSLKNPQHVFCLLEDYGSDPNNIPEHPDYIYFGRWVSYNSLFCLSYDNYSTPTFSLIHASPPDSRWTAWTHSLTQREEPTLHREHQYGCWPVTYYVQPR